MLAFASIHSNFSWSFDLHPIGANVSPIFRVNGHKVASVYKLSVVGWIGLQKGKILEVKVKDGQSVEAGELLLVMEAMKMEHRIVAPKSGKISKISFSVGDQVQQGDTLVEMAD